MDRPHRTCRRSRRAFLAAALASTMSGLVLGERTYRLGVLASNRDAWDEGQAVTKELAVQGFVEGRNLVLVERYLRGDPAFIDKFAAELVEAKVDAILTRATVLTRAVLDRTRTIPVVTVVWNPVESGLAKSLTASGRNVTGLALNAFEWAVKVVEVARTLVPGARNFVVFVDPHTAQTHLPPFERAAKAASMGFHPVVGTREDVEEWIGKSRSNGENVAWAHGYVESERSATLAIARRLPLLCNSLRGVQWGCLATYGQIIRDEDRRTARITAAILRGADPSRIPFELPDSENLAINRSTARKLGLAIPYSLQLKVDEFVD